VSVRQTLPERHELSAEPRLVSERPRRRLSPALGIFLWSRAAIWIGALFALLVFEPNRNPDAARFDAPFLHDLGYFTDIWARSDSKFYVGIAEHGYRFAIGAPAFPPLYPGAIRVLGKALFGHYVLAGMLISLAACLGAFMLLYRIAEERLGAEGARRTVVYLAVFPMSVFLQAVYTESLFLLLVLGAFFLADRGQWLGAWTSTGLAALTRSAGFALVPALALLAWRSPDRRRALAGLPLVPALFSIFPLVLWRETDHPWSFLHAHRYWSQHVSPFGPLAGIWAGIHDGVTGLWRLLSHGPAVRTSIASGPDFETWKAAFDVQALLFLVVFAVLTVIAWRRFGSVYGLFAALSLAFPLSTPATASTSIALQSLPRYVMAIFPCFLALAWIGRQPGRHTVIVAVSSVLLGLSVVQWALWQWVA
jgi:hypothetical protein